MTDSGRVDVVLYFVRFHRALASALPGLTQRVLPHGSVWVFWPAARTKKTNLCAEDVRHLAHLFGMVEGKETAAFNQWVGMKLTLPAVD